ncbi:MULTISPECIES: hypothetical protein [Streptomyces]|uniref:Uncharacterized protein n=1 Tax=Streptomyces venezuelae TaxID=54571 RepID=A0A5P2BCG0_STRVZ|nr:hypothetical protein [Streptomyces venezuelae]MYY84552.1 hypothetical protein [Streptomyces sp. SID335]NDZ91240.1 hypothetical protein [Streptomyces sp. SID10115]NEA06488.1 hypothetical protein [Streptomyces sp. SID10116]NEB43383.1 hypothetical protein [Streptomyces sp. SID339]QES26911.1 hypothetical protein DEJ47_10900 [Streptomyces venezuelae]
MTVVSADVSLAPSGTASTGRNPPLRHFLRRYRVPLLATVPTLPLYAVWVTFLATGGGDLAAQEAWARFASEHGTAAYNLFWYGGMHTANYSLISPYLMAALGVKTVTAVSGIAGAWLVAVLIVRTGVRRPLWPAVLASLAVWCNVASGRTTFALGLAFGLAACLALVGRRRTVVAVVCAALATMGSPVAGLFLVVAGAGYFFVRDWVRSAALILPPFLVVGATTLLFPFTGEHLMPFDRIFPPVLFSLALIVAGPREWRVLRWGAGVYAVGTVLTYLIPSPIGTNVERLAELVGPAVLLAALLAPGLTRARRITLTVALVLSSAWVAQKTLDDLRISTKVPKWAVDTHGVVRELERLEANRTRVEVVPTRNHREATALAPYVNMARGWNRQLDIERGRLFYDGSFSATTYREWLDRWAVGYVVLPSGKPDGFAEDEAALVASRPAWLKPVWKDQHWQIFKVKDPVPLVSEPAAVVRSTGSNVVVRVPKRGSVTVRLVYSPWLRAEGACLKPHGEFTRLSVPAPGTYEISSGYGPSRNRDSTCR